MCAEISLSKCDGILSLYIDNNIIQSSMQINDPNKLVLSYSAAMIAGLLFKHQLNQITHIGLGGASLIRWFDYFFPQTKQLAVEINPQIIAIARSMFFLPNIAVIQQDGSQWIKETSQQSDLLLIDAFDGEGCPISLLTEEFFIDCYQNLSEHGMISFNWWGQAAQYHDDVRRLRAIFANRIIEVPAQTHGNIAVIGFKNKQTAVNWSQLKNTAERLSKQTNVNFVSLYYSLKSKNANLKKIFK